MTGRDASPPTVDVPSVSRREHEDEEDAVVDLVDDSIVPGAHTPNAPAVMRVKLDRPAAAGMREGCSPDSVMVTSGMKKPAMPMPWAKLSAKETEDPAAVPTCM